MLQKVLVLVAIRLIERWLTKHNLLEASAKDVLIEIKNRPQEITAIVSTIQNLKPEQISDAGADGIAKLVGI